MNVLVRSASYFMISTSKFVFKDAILFVAPCSLSTFLRQWNVKEKKSIFPHGKFNSIEEIRAQIEFPKYEDFYSSLKNENVPFELYLEAKTEYDRRLHLSACDSEKYNNFEDWLKSVVGKRLL